MVTPYRPHKDLEAAPLLDSGDHVPLPPAPDQDHEYHEISDEETTNSPHLDLGPSLMAEMEMMFSSLGQQPLPSPADHEGSNKSNELRERMSSTTSSKQRKQASVKPISSQDKKTLETAIAMANEISTRSMTAPTPTTPVSPNKRKFSFRFPSVGEHHQHEKNVEKRNFSEEAHSSPDLQVSTFARNTINTNNTTFFPFWFVFPPFWCFCFVLSPDAIFKMLPDVTKRPRG